MNIHKYKKIIKRSCMLFAVTGTFLLSACKNKNASIVLITNGMRTEDSASMNSAEEGVKKFAKNSNKTYTSVASKEQNTKGYEEAIDTALEAGAKVIICPGKEFETAVYNRQKDNLSVKFILLNGLPHAADSKKEKLRGNTHAVLFSEEQSGYLAGYSAVWEGNTNLGFMGGEKDDSTMYYGSGFVQGANDAAKEMGLKADQIVVRYGFLGTTLASPQVEQTAASWYDEGCQVIFGCDHSILNAIAKAASARGRRVITVDNILNDFSANVLSCISYNYGSAIYKVLNHMEEKEYPGGEAQTVKVGSDGVYIDFDHSTFHTFTPEKYDELCKELKSGSRKVKTVDVTKNLRKYKIENVTVNLEK